MVGHPWHYRGTVVRIAGNLNGLLLDVATWAAEDLIDSAVAAGCYRDGGTPERPWRSLKEETGGKADVRAYAWVALQRGGAPRAPGGPGPAGGAGAFPIASRNSAGRSPAFRAGSTR